MKPPPHRVEKAPELSRALKLIPVERIHLPRLPRVEKTPKPPREGRTRFGRLRGGYELITKKRNQLQPGYAEVEIVCRGGYELVTPSVTAVTLFFH
jgi:hypothetical protein